LSRPLQFASLSAREIRRKWLRLNDTRVFWSPRGLPNRIRSVMNHCPKPRELEQERSEDARHWNVLTDLRPEHVKYAQA
jgi:hypothetical protein